MKIIISHDVDHITAFEHFKDLFLLKLFIRSTIELSTRNISFKEYINRFSRILKNRLHNIEELIQFDSTHGVKPTLFFAVNNGLSLSYNNRNAKTWMNYASNQGIPVGVHGIEYNTKFGIEQEVDKFLKLAGYKPFGIRMHYLRFDHQTLSYLEKSGYQFDSSIFKFSPAYKSNGIVEFPIHIMDSSLIYGDSFYQEKSLDQIKSETITCISKAESMNLNYLNVVTHDFYFSESFKTWKDWYVWFVEYLNEKNYEFINFDSAMKEINN